MSDDSSQNWIDQQLRQVPLPEGLLERLRAAGRMTDGDVDEALVDVPLPAGLVERLTLIVDDELLDARIADVHVPAGLLDDLLFVPYEDRLNDVTVPADLLLELRRIPPRPRRRLSALQVALAASLLLMITAGYALSMSGLVLSAYDPFTPPPVAVFRSEERGVDLVSSVDESEALAIAVMSEPGGARGAGDVVADAGDVFPRTVKTQTVANELDSWIGPGHRWDDDILPLKYGLLGHLDNTADRTPNLELLGGPAARGVSPPVALGFDRQFLITQRTQPVVSFHALEQIAKRWPESEIEQLLDRVRHSRVPLWSVTTSFDRLRGESGRLPPAEEIHVEDFLAAMDFQYETAGRRELALRVYGGPSAFGQDGAQLLQVGVQAGDAGSRRRPLHLTLAVDVSESMRWGERLEMVRVAIVKLTRQLTADDRVSLVIFNNEAFALVEDAAGDDRDTLAAMLDGLTPRGATNLGAGLQQAAVTAMRTVAAQHPSQRRLIIISDGAPAAPRDVAERMHALLDEVAASGVTVDVVDVGASADGDAGLAQVAAMVGRERWLAKDADELHVQLAQQLTGRSPVIADEAVLRVTFNPRAVRAYRLLGHEATTVGGLLESPVESTVTAGQAATALYEVWLYPDSPDSDNAHVADVEVSWRDAASGRRDVRRQEVRRVQFVPSLSEAPLPLQAATIAAEAAEVLRQSPFAGRSRDLSDVLALAKEVNPRLGERAAFQRYLEVLREAGR